MTARALLGARPLGMLLAAVAMLAGCSGKKGGGDGGSPPPYHRPKTAAQVSDSVWAVRLAVDALRGMPGGDARTRVTSDTTTLRVDSFTRGSEGYQIRLLPAAGGTKGGGLVWVGTDSSATVIKRY